LVTGGAIEVNTVPRFCADDGQGGQYSRIPTLQFPADAQGRTVLIHDLTHYGKAALHDQVAAWLAGGEVPSGRFDARAALVPKCKARPLALRQGPDKLPIRGLEQWLATCTLDDSTFGLEWRPAALQPWRDGLQRGEFPHYFRRDGQQLVAVADDAVPPSTGLQRARFAAARSESSYTSPAGGDSCWSKPGPEAGPFTAELADGSTVTWSWYRFVDQPSLQDADLDADAKARLQAVVEQIHRHWTPDKDYLPPPRRGALAQLDGALLVTPPRGLEAGYVPIVTRQAPR
jgi:hypothetical protein